MVEAPVNVAEAVEVAAFQAVGYFLLSTSIGTV